MAKKSKIAKNEQRRATVARHAGRRAELKEVVRRPSSTEAERLAAQRELRRQPRDASPTRVRNRDQVDGRPRGYLRTFGLSRVNLREQAHAGHLPGSASRPGNLRLSSGRPGVAMPWGRPGRPATAWSFP